MGLASGILHVRPLTPGATQFSSLVHSRTVVSASFAGRQMPNLAWLMETWQRRAKAVAVDDDSRIVEVNKWVDYLRVFGAEVMLTF